MSVLTAASFAAPHVHMHTLKQLLATTASAQPVRYTGVCLSFDHLQNTFQKKKDCSTFSKNVVLHISNLSKSSFLQHLRTVRLSYKKSAEFRLDCFQIVFYIF